MEDKVEKTHHTYKPALDFTLDFKILRSDIKQLADIHVEALRDDRSATVKFADKEEFRYKIEEMLERQVLAKEESEKSEFSSSSVNQWFIVKASLIDLRDDSDTEKIIGWASWLHEPSILDNGPTTSVLMSEDRDVKENNQKLLHFQHGLGAFVRQHQARLYAEWRRRRSEEASYLSLRACFVLPEFQRHGIGGALIRYGCERADLLGLDTLVTSTQAAKSLYESVGGFKVFEHLDVNLNAFDEKLNLEDLEGQENTRPYRFWFLRRVHGGEKRAICKDL